MIPKNISRKHILNAIEEIDRSGIPKGRKSKKFQLLYNNRYYPPKYVISLANKYANEIEFNPSEFSGGQETNDFLKKLGFEVVKLKPYAVSVKPWSTPRKIWDINNMNIPNQEEFYKGIKEYEKHEKRDAMYKVATFLVSHFWGKPFDMADGLGVLLLTWNQAFYRYGIFDFDRLERCIANNLQKLENLRRRDIFSLSDVDEKDVKYLFNEFLDALRISSGKNIERKSPVSAAKALHLLAPNFFPIWDDKIARAYGCHYSRNPDQKYITFCKIMKILANNIKEYVVCVDKSILKLIDEYNYSKYTKMWI